MRWKTVIVLGVLGLATKILLSATVDDNLGTWVGGAFGIAAVAVLISGAFAERKSENRPK